MTSARVHSLTDLTEGSRASIGFRVTAEQMRNFAELSGDFNPLHTDAAFAKHKGHAGPVVYGALLIAKVSQLIGMELPGRDSTWASLSLDFRRPLYVDHAAEVEGTVTSVHPATGLIELSLVLRSEGKVLAKGKAEVVLAR
jgi:3-hydroxybutyryl-CoA dehydratase